jgi:predicted Zn-dependent peptidase
MKMTLIDQEEVLKAFAFELDKLGRERISELDLEIVKQRLKSGYIFSLESMNSRMYRLGKNQLLLGRHYTEEETMAEIDSVTLEEIYAVCKRISDFSVYSGVAISKNKLDIKKMMQL